MSPVKEIYPVFGRMLQRSDREKLLGQKGILLWFTGLSGAGKTTLALALERELYRQGCLCRLLDGDNIRYGLNKDLGFSAAARTENIRRIAEVSRLFVDSGIVTLAAFISPTREMRRLAADIVGKEDFYEIYLDTPLEVCEQRDVKGLYRKARRGEIPHFTGISAPFEPPENPFLQIDTGRYGLRECVGRLLAAVGPKIRIHSI